MTTLNKEYYFYFKLESNEEVTTESILSLTDLSLDIIIDFLSIDDINESLLNCLEEINEYIISKGLCMVLLIKDVPSNIKPESFNILPTLIEARDYLQIEQIQRDLGV